MNTPQEEAQDMANRIAIDLFGGQPNSKIGKQIVSREAKKILDGAAIAELIAVARAAIYSGSNSPEFTVAEESLRATGKVTL